MQFIHCTESFFEALCSEYNPEARKKGLNEEFCMDT